MLSVIPTSVAGLHALVEYAAERFGQDEKAAIEYLPAIVETCRAILPGSALRGET